MSSLVGPPFEYDVFISHGNIPSRPDLAVQRQGYLDWKIKFVEHLRTSLTHYSPKPPVLYFAEDALRIGSLEQFQDAAKLSAVFLAIRSQWWCGSEHCIAELKAFCAQDHSARMRPTKRIAIVDTHQTTTPCAPTDDSDELSTCYSSEIVVINSFKTDQGVPKFFGCMNDADFFPLVNGFGKALHTMLNDVHRELLGSRLAKHLTNSDDVASLLMRTQITIDQFSAKLAQLGVPRINEAEPIDEKTQLVIAGWQTRAIADVRAEFGLPPLPRRAVPPVTDQPVPAVTDEERDVRFSNPPTGGNAPSSTESTAQLAKEDRDLRFRFPLAN